MSDMNFAHSAQSVANSNETTIRTTEISVTLGYMLDALRDIANTLRRPEPKTPAGDYSWSDGLSFRALGIVLKHRMSSHEEVFSRGGLGYLKGLEGCGSGTVDEIFDRALECEHALCAIRQPKEANTLRQPKEAPATPPVLTGPSPVIVDVGCEIEYLFERPSKTTLLFRVPCDFSVAEKVFGDFAGSRGVSLEEAIKILKEAVASNNQ